MLFLWQRVPETRQLYALNQEGNKMAEEKTFTQAEMDSIIEGRLAREREKYADYDSLKEKAGKYDAVSYTHLTLPTKA